MNGFLLDTNVPSELVRPQPDPKIMAWIDAQSLDDLYVSVISFGECRKGTTILEPGKRRTELEAWINDDVAKMFAGRILPMTQNIAERWGVLEGRGSSLVGRCRCPTRKSRQLPLNTISRWSPATSGTSKAWAWRY